MKPQVFWFGSRGERWDLLSSPAGLELSLLLQPLRGLRSQVWATTFSLLHVNIKKRSRVYSFGLFLMFLGTCFPTCLQHKWLLQECLYQEEWLYITSEPHCSEHRWCKDQDWFQWGPPCLGSMVGGPFGHCGSDRNCYETGPYAVPRLCGIAGEWRPELGLESGGQ